MHGASVLVRDTRQSRGSPQAHSEPAFASPSGVGELAFTRIADRTVVTRAFATSPLKILRPRSRDHAAWVYLSSHGGGLVGDDAPRLAIDVGPAARALVTTQASTKVYRSRLGASQRVRARVGKDGLLVLLPDPIVCFAGASFFQDQEIDLEERASLVLVDWLTAGRVARGERWAFDEYRSRLRIRRDGRLAVHDGLWLSAADGSVPDRLGRFNALLLLILMGPLVRGAAADLLTRSDQWSVDLSTAAPDRSGAKVERRSELIVTIAPVEDDAVLIRMAGVSLEAMGQWLRTELGFLPALVGKDFWSRKWR